MASSILTHAPTEGQFPPPNFNSIATDQQHSVPLPKLAEFLEWQYARHLLDNNNHILVILRFQAAYLGISLDYDHIAAQVPGHWSIEELHRANSKAHNCRQRAKLHGLRRHHFRGHDWLRLVDFYGGCCVRCGVYCPAGLTADHVIPLSYGPPDTSNSIANIQPLCDPCHVVKEFLTLVLGQPADYRQSLPDWVAAKGG